MVFKDAGFQEVRKYRYWHKESKGLDFTGVSTAIVKSIGDQLKATNDYLNNPNA